MKKRKFITLFFMLLIGLLVLSACGNNKNSQETTSDNEGATNEETIVLSLNVLAPPEHPFTTTVAEPWADYVEEKTDGRIKIDVFPSAALGPLNTAYEDIQGGVYDLGNVSPTVHQDTDVFPLSIAELPFAISDPSIVDTVMGDFYEEFMAESGLEDNIFLGAASTDSFQIYSRDPIEKVEDMKNKTISTTGAERANLFKSWGAAPVSLSNTELYEALDRGTTEQVAYTAIGANGFSLYEVAPYLVKLDLGIGSINFHMNKNKFDSLPADLQELFIDDLAPKYIALEIELYSSQSDAAIEQFAEEVEGKGAVIELGVEETNNFKSHAEPLWDAWAEEANNKGFPGDEMIDFFKNKLAEQGVELPF